MKNNVSLWCLSFLLVLSSGFSYGAAPGGVSGGLELWLKGDAGVSTDAWVDQAGNNTMTVTHGALESGLSTLNFNNVAAFDGADLDGSADITFTEAFVVGHASGGFLSGAENRPCFFQQIGTEMYLTDADNTPTPSTVRTNGGTGDPAPVNKYAVLNGHLGGLLADSHIAYNAKTRPLVHHEGDASYDSFTAMPRVGGCADLFDLNDATLSMVSATNSIGTLASLYNGIVDTGPDSFHGQRVGLSGDWGIAVNLNSTNIVTQVGIQARPGCCQSRMNGVVAKLYKGGVLVYTSDPVTDTGVEIKNIAIPSVSADELRLVYPGTNGGDDDGWMNFSELYLSVINTSSLITGNIAEMIVYSAVLSDADRHKVESYLGIKYGTTLDASIVNYVNSAGSAVFALNDGYNNDVIGLANDSGSGLDQRVTTTNPLFDDAAPSSVLTLSTTADFTGANDDVSRVSLTDGQYLTIGHNGAATQTIAINGAPLFSLRTERVWKVKNTGGVGDVHLKFAGFNNSSFLLFDADGDFSAGATTVEYLNADGEVSATLNDGYYVLGSGRAVPDTPDLQAASDSGSSATDDITNITTPSFDVTCIEAGATIHLYTDKPTADTLVGTHECAAEGVEVVVSDPLAGDVIHNITYTETDVTGGHVSARTAALAVTVDVTNNASSTLVIVNNDGTLSVSGTAEPDSVVTVTFPDATTGSITADVSGNYGPVISGSVQSDGNVSSDTVDVAGNSSATTTVVAIGLAIDGLDVDTVDENVASGTPVSVLTSDASIATYSLTCATAGANDTAFSITGSELSMAEVPVYETQTSYEICIRGSDGTNTYDEYFTITINESTVTYTEGAFTEGVANDGSVSGSLVATLSTDTFQSTLTEGTHYTIPNKPAGLVGSMSVSGNVATLTFTDVATDHLSANDVTALTITFKDGAFTTASTAADVTNYTGSTSSVTFDEQPSLVYAGNFTEVDANDGSVVGPRTVTITGDTFKLALVEGTDYGITNMPAGLSAGISVSADGTVATLILGGNATAHTSNETINNLTMTFNDGAFTKTLLAENVTAPSDATGAVTFNDQASLVYAGNFLEKAANDGSVSGEWTVTLTDDTFKSSLVEGVDYTMTNVPAGLSAGISVSADGTVATLSLGGNATAHTSNETINNLTMTFNDGAFTKTLLAENVTSPSDATGKVTFKDQASLTYDGNFTEVAANDGSVDGTRTATITGDTFKGAFVEGTDYVISGVPSGLVGVLERTSDTVATLTLDNNADAHSDLDDLTSGLTITFKDGAFTNTAVAANVIVPEDTAGAIDFNNQPTLAYAGNFIEVAANDGSVSGEWTATLTDDTFKSPLVEGADYTMSNMPAGLSAGISVSVDGTVATLSLGGNATAHTSNETINNLTMTFNDGAFTKTLLAENVTAPSDATGKVTFKDQASLTYEGNFTEVAANDGSVDGTRTATITGDTFKGTLVEGTDYVISGVPSGLLGVLERTSDTVATLTLDNNADAHSDLDDLTSGLTITFKDGAFTNTAVAANVIVPEDTAGAIDFNNQPTLAYAGNFIEVAANDGSVSGEWTATLTDDTFKSALVDGADYTMSNMPAGLSAGISVSADGTVATLSLGANATAHTSNETINNLTMTFNDGAFTKTLLAENVTAPSNATGVVTFNNQASLVYNGDFLEKAANDGSVLGEWTATLTDDTFKSPLVEGSDYTMSNMPAGLTAGISVSADGTVATLSLGGNATAHTSNETINNLTMTFNDGAFTKTLLAENVTAPSDATGAVTFNDQASLVYNGDFLEKAANDGSVSGEWTATLTDDTFKSPLVEGADYTMSNMPAGLIAGISVSADGTVATLSLGGNATAHTSNETINNLTMTFNDGAFTKTLLAENVTAPSDATGAVTFNDQASLVYNGDFLEKAANDGSVSGERTATLSDDTFNVILEAAHYTIGNVPAGLTAVVKRTSGTVATLTLSGNALAHTNDADIANLTITFNDGAFTKTTLAENVNAPLLVVGKIDFNDAATLVYAGNFLEVAANDGSVSGERTATLTDDTFKATLVDSIDYSVVNVPVGLTAELIRTSDTVVTLKLSGNAVAHTAADAADVNDLTITFIDGAFTDTTLASNVMHYTDVAGRITFNDLLADIGTDAKAGDNTNTSTLTAAQLNNIVGVSGADEANEAAYQAAIAANEGPFSNPATAIELQTMISLVNEGQTLLANIGEDAGTNGNIKTGVLTADNFNNIVGVSDAITANEAAYLAAIAEGLFTLGNPATAAEVKAMIDSVNEGQTLLANIGEDAGTNGNTKTGVLTAGNFNNIVGVSDAITANEAAYLAAIAADDGSFTFGNPATAAEVQLMIDSVNAAQTVLVNIGTDAAKGDNENTGALTAAELNNIVGVSGAIETSEAAYRQAIADDKGPFSNPATATEVQLMIKSVNDAIDALNAAAKNDEEGGLTVDQYTGAGISGVDAGNLAAVNAALAAVSEGDLALTAAEIQDLVNKVIAGVEALNAAAKDDEEAGLTVDQYTDAGITGVDEGNLAVVNAALAAVPIGDLDLTAAEIQDLVDKLNEAKDALNAAAKDDEEAGLTVDQYTGAGISGVDADNLAAVNAALAAVPKDDLPLTAAEIQELVNKVNAATDALNAAAKDNKEGGLSVDNYTDAGITGVDADNLAAVNAALAAVPQGDLPLSAAEIQALVDKVNAAVDALNEAAKDNKEGGLSVDQYTDAGISGVDADNLGAVNAALAAVSADDLPLTADEIQALVDDVNAAMDVLNEAAAGDAESGLTVDDYAEAGIAGVDASNLSGVNAALAAVPAADLPLTAADIQAIVNELNAINIAKNYPGGIDGEYLLPDGSIMTLQEAMSLCLDEDAGDVDEDGISNKSDAYGDSDLDGLMNCLDVDSDDDYLLDGLFGAGREFDGDENSDGIKDYIDPSLTDSDGDGISDALEIYFESITGNANTDPWTDSDGDGIPDIVELLQGSSIMDSDSPIASGDADSDSDGVSDAVEANLSALGIDAVDRCSDFDRDGYSDSLEVSYGANPLVSSGRDQDDDGLLDWVEIALSGIHGLAPYSATLFDEIADYDALNGLDYIFFATQEGACSGSAIVTAASEKPVMWVTVSQNAKSVYTVSTTQGDATLYAQLGNSQTGVSGYDWTISDATTGYVTDQVLLDNVVGSTDGSRLVFNPSSLIDGGIYTAVVAVTRGAYTSHSHHTFKVVANSVPLLDQDSDGIPNYNDVFDATRNANYFDALQTDGAGGFGMSVVGSIDALGSSLDNAVMLGLGSTAFAGGVSPTVSFSDLAQYGSGKTEPLTEEQLLLMAEEELKYPSGFFDFVALNLPEVGAYIKVVIPLTSPLPENGMTYRKFNPNNGVNAWADFDETDGDTVSSAISVLGECPPPGDSAYELGLVQGATCVQLLIKDGGLNDADGPNGNVRDPGGPALSSNKEVTIGRKGHGGGSFENTGVVLLALFLVFRLYRRQLLVSLMALLFVAPAYAEKGEWFVGGGVGISNLVPGLGDTGFQLDDENDIAYQVFGGYDVYDWLAAEIYVASQGEVTFSAPEDASVEYQTYGMSGLFYYPGSSKGWSAYGKLGLSGIHNDSKDVGIEHVKDVQLHLGAGLEYQITHGTSLRADYTSVDKDVQFLTLNILRRFGKGGSKKQQTLMTETDEQKMPAVAFQDDEIAEPLEKAVVERVDDQLDEAVAADIAIGSFFDSIDGKLKSVYFSKNSSELARRPRLVLGEVADLLVTLFAENPSAQVEIRGYADSLGSDHYNQWLSERRTESVKNYLAQRGVSAERLMTKGFGERNPVLTNDSAEGRAENRRIDFVVVLF